jgi:hypothetical protein
MNLDDPALLTVDADPLTDRKALQLAVRHQVGHVIAGTEGKCKHQTEADGRDKYQQQLRDEGDVSAMASSILR